MGDDEKREHLLAVPNVGRVVTLKHANRPDRIAIDFSPELRGTERYLWTFAGQAFESLEAAEMVRLRICQDAARLALPDAVARYRGRRSRVGKATTVIDSFLEAAPTLQSERTGHFLAPRTVKAYSAVLRRARPFFEGLTMAELMEPTKLREFKAWFRLPAPQGRGLKSDQEARNAFAALRAVVTWYRIARPDFPAPKWPSMPTALRAKRENESERKTVRLSLGQAVRAIEAIPENRRAIFWVMFFCGARPTEARGVLGKDWDRPVLEIRRSAESRSGGCAVRPRTKTGESGAYHLPEWLCELIDKHSTAVRFDRSSPLFVNPDPKAPRGVISDDSLFDTWRAACDSAEVPRVPLYRATKHTPFSALRLAGVPLESLSDLYRWMEPATADHYDQTKNERRSEVVARLGDLVEKARGGT